MNTLSVGDLLLWDGHFRHAGDLESLELVVAGPFVFRGGEDTSIVESVFQDGVPTSSYAVSSNYVSLAEGIWIVSSNST